MRTNRNQCLATLLIFSLLTSLVPPSFTDATEMENPVSAAVKGQSVLESAASAVSGDQSVLESALSAVSGDQSVLESALSAVIGGISATEDPVSALDEVPGKAAGAGKDDSAAVQGNVSDIGMNDLTKTKGTEIDYLDIGNCGANLTYVLDGSGCLSITGEGDMTNYTDASAVPWFSFRSFITKVSFNGNITNIGAYAFDYCVNLTSISIPDSVISIGAYSFYGCSGIRKITIPGNVTGIGAYAFSGCTNLSSVTISDHVASIGASAFAGCTSLTDITIPDSVTSIGENAFENTGIDTSEIAFRRGNCGIYLKWALMGNHQLYIYGTGDMTDYTTSSAPWYSEREKITEVILTNGATGVGDYAFAGCKQLTSVVLADTVTRIGKYAFAQCSSVSGVDLGNITEIAEHAFEQSGLTEVRISGSDMVTVGNDAFASCAFLKTVTLEQCVLKTGDRIWKGCTGLEEITVSAGFAEMGSSLFADCTALSRVTLAGNCSDIGAYQFSRCTALTELSIPNGVTELGKYAFQDCTGITEITLPDSVKDIQAGVFSGCRGLEKIQFSKQLETIGDDAFQNCIKFTSLVIPDSVTSMGSGVFSGCGRLESLTLPFVGRYKEAEEASQETLFGYVFGTAEYADASAVKQYYSESGYSTCYLPDSLVSVTVTGGELLYGAFDHCSNMKRITIPDTVTSIAPCAFRDCKGLEDIVVAAGVAEIGAHAFRGCSGLDSILLPEDLQKIDSGAFSDCTALEKIKLPPHITHISDSLFQGCSSLQELTIPGQVESIGREAFRGCTAIKSISLTACLTELGSGVFRDCTELQNVTVPEGVVVIPDEAFSGCTALKEVVIAGDVTGIGKYAFANCALLEGIRIPETVTEIGSEAFSGCAAIKDMNLPQSITQIGSRAFQNCAGLTGIEVPQNTQTIGSAAFSGCSALKSISLPFTGGSAEAQNASSSTLFGYIFGTTAYEGGTAAKQFYSGSGSATYYIPDALTEVKIAGGKIWYGSFSGCNHLESLLFLSGESITDIGAKAFQGCAGLIDLALPEGVQTIGDYAFSGCTGLKTISGMNDVKTIGSYAFQNCSSIKSISLSETVTTINTAAFSGCSSLESITLPFVGGNAGRETADRTSLFGYIFGTTNYTGAAAVQQKYSGSGTTTYYLPMSLRKVTVTGGKILYGAFYGCDFLTQLILPENLTEIGDYAFYHCVGITRLTLSKEMAKIGSYAFAGCSGMTEMVLPSSVESIGGSAFRDCTSLQEISIPGKVTGIASYLFSGCTALEKISIPNGVQTIDTYAFQNCSNITDITVPDSVSEIGAAAFSGCGRLQSMTLPFVGNNNRLTSASAKSVFGYIFGSKEYTGGTAVKQQYSTSGATYYIPASLMSVRITGGALLYGAFYGCSGLTQLTLPEDMTEVGKYAFYQCSGLKEISLPDCVAGIESYAFAGCSALRTFSFPSKVSSIENYTFSGCVSMEQITIPEGITKIGEGAFQNCSNLTRMIVPDSVMEIGKAAFSGCSKLQSVTLPFTGYSAASSAASAKSLFGYIFGTASYTGGVATKQYWSGSSSSTYYIPASLKNVVITGGNQMPFGTFYNCSGLAGITLPGTLTGIGQKAFYHCTGLSSITIPQNVTSIAANAFTECTEMRYVTFSGKAPETIAATGFTGVTATVFYPVSDTTWDDVIGNQYGGTLTWQPHTHSYQPVVTAPNCTEQGYTTYQCTRCDSSYVSDFVNALGHVSVIDQAVPATCTRTGLTEGSHCSVCGEVIVPQMTIQKTGHRFTEYISNRDATYEQDGTMTAQCNDCQTTETVTDPGSMLIDENKPTIEITVGTNQWTGFFHSITFGLFFKNTQTAVVQAADEEKLLDGSTVNRLDQVYYYISDTEIPSQDLGQAAWKKYTNSLTLDPDKKYIIYAKAVDRSGNITYASSTGMIVDRTAPVVDGISDGTTYCEEVVFAVTDLSLRSVTDNGTVIKATEGFYTITGDDQLHTIMAMDDCGNTTEISIVVNRHHDWKEPVFFWDDSYKSCTAEYTCRRDIKHAEQLDCTIQVQSLDADCIKAGHVVYTATASLDGVRKTDSQTVSGIALGHEYEPVFAWSEDRFTCMAALTCKRAGCSNDTTGHLLSNLPCVVETRTTAATCVSQGKREVVASLVVDGVEYKEACSAEVIPFDHDNHVHTQIFNKKAATCLAEGATGDVYCLDCKKIVERSVATERLAHVWDEGVTTKTATCIETGIQLHTCMNGCGTVWEKEIPVDSEQHGNLRIVGAKEATMTEAGYTGDTCCDDCKQTVVYGSVIPAAGDIGGAESPSPKPGSTENPSPIPGSTATPPSIPDQTESPSWEPGGVESPTPGPDQTGSPTREPGGVESPTPGPDQTGSPSWEPGGMESPTPGPDQTGGPTWEPGGMESPTPVPGGVGNPSPDPGSIGDSFGNGNADGKPVASPQETSDSNPASGASMVLTKGTVFAAGKLKYQITGDAGDKLTVSVKEPVNRNVKKLTIPATVKTQGKSYRVTAIADYAFRNCGKLKKITVGKNITVIGKKAFYQAKNLKQIVIRSTRITRVGKNAWKGINPKAVIQVPKKKRKKYQKLFRDNRVKVI